MLTTAAYTDLRNYIKGRIGSAEYEISGVWHAAAIAESVIMADGTVRIKCQVSPGAVCTITGVRLKNAAGDVWATKAVNLDIDSASTSLLQWFDFEIRESEVNP